MIWFEMDLGFIIWGNIWIICGLNVERKVAVKVKVFLGYCEY